MSIFYLNVLLFGLISFLFLPATQSYETIDSSSTSNDTSIVFGPVPHNVSGIDIQLKSDSSNTFSFIMELVTPILAFVGVIVGAFLTFFVGVMKERPINSRTRQLVSFELNTYKGFLEKIKEKDVDKKDSTYINIDQKDTAALKMELTNFLVSHFGTMSIDKRIQVFSAESLYKLEICYRNYHELNDEIERKLSQKAPRVRIERSKTTYTLNLVIEAVSSIN